MRKTIILLALVALLLLCLSTLSTAQTSAPSSPTPVVVTATPMPQVIVVTATPSAPPPSKGFWEENSKSIITGLIGLVFGGILVWVLKPTFEKLGNAIAGGLSKLGSGWGFKRRYLTHLTEEYRGLNIRGLKTKAPVTVELEQVYVSLHAQVPDKALGRQEPPALGVGQAMDRHQRLAILGGPGTGKTTLMAYLTLTYARNRARDRLGLKEKRLPILVPLRQLKAVLTGGDGPTTLPAYLARWYTDLGLHPREDFFDKALRDGRCLVLLDGLDEVADEAERRAMSEWVDRLVTVYPDNRYIVTSRPPGYDSAPLENGFTVVRIRDFTDTEIRQFATNWCLAVELAAQGADNPTARRKADEAARDLVGAIETNPAIRKLAVNPLLLSIIALVHRYRATLPKRRVDLYAECVDVLLVHWDEAKGLAGKLSPGGKRAVLQPLALQMHQGKQRDIPRRELEARIAGLLPAVGGEAAEAADFLDEVRERSGLLIEAGVGTWAFSHLTFQEYLCARELVDLVPGEPSVQTGFSLPALRQALDEQFDEEELQTLAFDLGVQYEDLTGEGQAGKARELVELMARRRRLPELAERVEALRPSVTLETPVPPEQDGRDLLLGHVGDEWWQEVTLLYVGLAPATPIVEALLAGDDPDGSRLRLAGHCVAEAVRLDEAVRQQVMSRLEGDFATCTGERFLETGQVLAEVAGEDSVDFFLRLAHDDPERREAALWSLGQMGRQPNEVLAERVVERLLEHFLREEQETVTVEAEGVEEAWEVARFRPDELQQEAIAALVEIWGIQLIAELSQRQVLPFLLEQAAMVLAEAMDSMVVTIPAGEFTMGSREASDEKPIHKIHLDTFRIDKYPVTNAQYKRFVDATGREPPAHWKDGTYPPDKAIHPVVNVTWHDAVAYAEWAGKRLPTETEWEKAARGADGRVYPWGDEFDKDKCNTKESGIKDTTPVGQYSPGGDSPYGCCDMAGNVWEWTSSIKKSYPYDPEDGREDADASGNRVLRGGSWDLISDWARSAYRVHVVPSYRLINGGFRCVIASTSSSL